MNNIAGVAGHSGGTLARTPKMNAQFNFCFLFFDF